MINNEIPNPAEDRDEFEKRLKSIFKRENVDTEYEMLEAIIMNNTEKLDEYRTEITTAQAKIDNYLSEWDSAKDNTERMNVISSVNPSL